MKFEMTDARHPTNVEAVDLADPQSKSPFQAHCKSNEGLWWVAALQEGRKVRRGSECKTCAPLKKQHRG